MRERLTSYILHWKMMLFHGQNVVEFSGANYSADAFRPTATPYENYTDEGIYFTERPAIVNSFRTKFDDLWINTAELGELRQHHRAAGAPLRHLPEGSGAELPAARRTTGPGRARATTRRHAEDRRDHVSHHRPRSTPTR